jgi:L-iditol 2-dehydrogenase
MAEPVLAAVQTDDRRIELREFPRPAIGADDGLLRVEACGICGSDMHAYLGHDERRPAPLILGHEAAGVIVSGPRAGERVAVNPLVTCRRCDACLSGRTNLCAERQIISMPPREGAFAERVAVPEPNLVAVPDDVPLQKAALAEPVATSYHAVGLAERVSARPAAEWRAVVIGGGAIGMAAALVLRSRGVRNIDVAEPNPGRRRTLAREAGLRPYDPASGEPGVGSADVVVDAVGAAASRRSASRLARPGAVIVHIGLGEPRDGLDIRRLTLQEIAFIGAYTYTALDFRKAVEALTSGALGGLDWTEERPLGEGARAFAEIREGRVEAAKIVLRS